MGFFAVCPKAFSVIGGNYDESIVVQFLRAQSSNDLPCRRILCSNATIVCGAGRVRIGQLNPNEE